MHRQANTSVRDDTKSAKGWKKTKTKKKKRRKQTKKRKKRKKTKKKKEKKRKRGERAAGSDDPCDEGRSERVRTYLLFPQCVCTRCRQTINRTGFIRERVSVNLKYKVNNVIINISIIIGKLGNI